LFAYLSVFKPFLILKKLVILNDYIWHWNCLLYRSEALPLDENLFIRLVNDIENSDGLNEEDKDLLKRLARKAAEIEVNEEN
jgi:hypothetical protein